MTENIDTSLLSYTFTCHKRTKDLLAVMPSVVAAANQSPSVEIVIIDYGDQPPLKPILEKFRESLLPNNKLVIKTYRKRSYYHMGHARNLSLRVSNGEYVIIGASDIILNPSFFSVVRKQFEETGATYLRSMTSGYVGILACKREALLAIGGWDERFEFYGPEDKDVLRRLDRCGAKIGYYDLDKLISMIPTPDSMKTANYRLPLSKKEMSLHGRAFLIENDAVGRIVVNEGIPWGED